MEKSNKPTSNNPPDSFLTIAGPATAEIKERRSRFIALTWPVSSEDEATTRIAEAERRFHDSRHVCHAWRLGIPPDTRENSNDAGEPSGTAGKPLLTAVRQAGLVETLVVVVRYFGGIKLGTGGLARAYGQAACDALDNSERKEVFLGREFQLAFQYPIQKTIRHFLSAAGGRILKEEYSDEVAWKIWLPHSQWRQFEGRLTESTAGAVSLMLISDDSRKT